MPAVQPSALELWALVAAGGQIRLEVAGGAVFLPCSAARRFERLVGAQLWDGEPHVAACSFRRNPGWVDDPQDRRVVAKWVPGDSSVLWARCETPDERERLDHFAPGPTLILKEGATRVALWALSQPLSNGWTVTLNRRLAHRLGSKKAHAETWFQFAPPGCVLRSGRKRAIKVEVEQWSGELHSARAVAGGLEDPPDPRAAWKARQAA